MVTWQYLQRITTSVQVRTAGVVVPLAYHTVQGEATLDSLLYQKFVDSVDIIEDHVLLDLNWVAEVGSKVIFWCGLLWFH